MEGEKFLSGKGLLELISNIIDEKLHVHHPGDVAALPNQALADRVRVLEREREELTRAVEAAQARIADAPKPGPPAKSSKERLSVLKDRQEAYTPNSWKEVAPSQLFLDSGAGSWQTIWTCWESIFAVAILVH